MGVEVRLSFGRGKWVGWDGKFKGFFSNFLQFPVNYLKGDGRGSSLLLSVSDGETGIAKIVPRRPALSTPPDSPNDKVGRHGGRRDELTCKEGW